MHSSNIYEITYALITVTILLYIQYVYVHIHAHPVRGVCTCIYTYAHSG